MKKYNEKMNIVIRDVILEKWKSKIGYPFDFKDLAELEIVIKQFENQIEYLKGQLKRSEKARKEAIEYINTTDCCTWDNTSHEDLLKILDIKENKIVINCHDLKRK